MSMMLDLPLTEAWWSYLVVVGSLAGSAVFPPLPSESMMFAAGALAGAGELSTTLVLIAGATGSLLGDVLGYLLGRLVGERALERIARTPQGRRSVGWARRSLLARGGPLIAAARFVPGGQTAASVTAGSLGLPWPRLAPFAGLGALVWAIYGTLVGALGGRALQEGTWLGVIVAIVLVAVVLVAARLLAGRIGR